MKKKRSFVVIGLGRLGSTVAPALAEMGDEVLGIDVNETLVRRNADLMSQALIVDARDEHALAEAGVGGYDVALIAIGEDLESNILATMNVKNLGVKTIWAKAQSETHQRILSRIGVDRIIRPERDMGLHIAETLHTPYVSDYINLGKRQYLVSLVIQQDMKRMTLGDLYGHESDPEGWNVAGAMRGAQFISDARADFELQEGDRLLVVGSKMGLRRLSDIL